MNAGLLYLNPALAASSRLFRELNRDTPLLRRFIVASSQLVTDVAERRDDVAGLVDHLDPLVEESKPVAKKLRPFMAELRPLARDARPTLRDLADVLRRPGADNDLVELNRLQPPLRDATVRDVQANGKRREGAFPAAARAMRAYVPELAAIRPYTPDVVGWMDDFSHSGIYDALGASSRVAVHASAFTFLNGQLSPVPPELRGQAFQAAAALNQRNRCPGAAEPPHENGPNPWSTPGV